MSGFSGIHIYDDDLAELMENYRFPGNLVGFFIQKGLIGNDHWKIAHYGNSRFVKDSFLKNSTTQITGIDGTVLKIENNFSEAVDIKGFIDIIRKTKGSFSALYKDIVNEELLLFTDQTGSRQIFYYWNSQLFAFSSSIFLLISILRHFQIKISLSEPASYMMLSLGYMLEDYTLVSEIKKVKAGNYIRISRNGVSINKYHDYYQEVKYNHISEDLLVELNDRFINSLKLEYEKDISYDYKHLATLSGGLDSRMNVMLALNIGYGDITCLTFTEGNSEDENTASLITSDYSLRHVILKLCNGIQLFEIEDPLILNNCSVYYFGAASTFTAIKYINATLFGLMHNGGLAESSKGGYLSGKTHREPSLDIRYAVSDKLFSRLDPHILSDIFRGYQNEEMFITYNRGFNAINNGLWMVQPYTDSVSTYMDLDFAEVAYACDPCLRYNGYLTIEWINQLHPALARYPYRYGLRPTNKKSRIMYGKVKSRCEKYCETFLSSIIKPKSLKTLIGDLDGFLYHKFQNSSAWPFITPSIQQDIQILFKSTKLEEKLLSVSFVKSVELLLARDIINERDS